MKRTALLFMIFLLFCAPGFAQNTTVTGTVYSALDSTTLSDVSVVVKGSSGGTTTGGNGTFSLTVSSQATLVFSSVGFTTLEVPVNGRSVINVYLEQSSTNQLSEVVVTTALGIKKQQKTLGYAVQEVNGETMAKTKMPTAVGALTGKVAGLNIINTTDLFQNPSISLRGRTPLIVIDGIPDPTADPYKINADDIENITVLKGTAAGALYGALGVNGAILYTTKKGKKGKLVVEVNSSTMFQTSYTVVPKVQTQYGNGDAGKYAYVDGSGNGTEGGGWIWGPKLDVKDPSTPSGYWETTQYNSPVDPNTGQLVPLPWVSRGKDNIKNYFRTGVLSTNSVSASIGSDRGSFRASAAHIYQKGVVPNTDVNNSSFSIGGNYNLTSKFNVDAKLTYNREYSDNYPTIGYGPPNILYNLLLWIGPDIDIRDLQDYWVKGKEGLQQKNYNLSWYNNPYFIANQLLNGYRRSNSFGQVTFDYKFAKDFSAKLRTGFNQFSIDQDVKEPYSYIAYDYISRGNYSITASNYFDITTDLILNYRHDFGDNLGVSVTLGGANAYRIEKAVSSSTDGLTIPEYYNLSNTINPIRSSNYQRERRTGSVYGMIDLEALKFLYFSFTGRYDKTSTLPVKNNGYFYPSFGVSAVLSDVLKLPEPISFLKARASWAKVNTGFINSGDPYAHLTTYSIGQKWNNVPSLVWPTTSISPDLVPETVSSGEYGIAVGLFGNRLMLDATYFRNKDYNNFVNVPQSQASGITSILKNANVYIRRGWEFMISGVPIKGKNFKWESGFNFSTVHRWLEDATESPDGYIGTLKEGDRTDKIFTWESRTPDGRAIYETNGMQAWSPYAQFFGYDDPDWIYGWQNTFTYKNVTLSFSVDGRIGGLIYSTTNQKMWWGGTAPGTVNQFRDDANAGQSTYVGPGVVVTGGDVQYDSHGNIISDTRKYTENTTAVNYISFMQTTSGGMLNNYFYYKGSYLKMRELVVTYNFPQKWTKNVFSSASISFIANNLFLIAKLPNVDPDAESDNLQTPSMRSLGVNLNLKF
ncbi:SusC/RagA family TonB-linked outer membrane protein [Pollutibacter soli]|uniref:SusC/RagA family TonB-linked outer membrane protein n=1 Tax=Pollutibacter soli TaxID=3034157 RepID=UPI0030132617